jgi:pimeloyl-ACP methyl ester carboxylesterase
MTTQPHETKMRLRRILRNIALLSLFLAAACAPQPQPVKPWQTDGTGTPPVYNYPIDNPYAATVIGVPPQMQMDYSSLPAPTDKTLVLFKDRHIPEGFWYDHGLKYSELLQPRPAPLVYVIAGTGADGHSGTMLMIADMLYSAGFSVVLLPSPTHRNFIINASENFVPGRPSQDAQDLYRVMKRIDPQVTSETKVTRRMLIGYSLGAIDALFTARLDGEQKSLNFGKVLLINPPLSLYRSMQTLDNLLYRSLPNGISDADHFIKTTVQRLSSVQQSSDALDFSNERLLIDAYASYKLGDNRLATIIGLSFRLAAVNMIFTADVMGHDGYIFPRNWEFTTGVPLDDYLGVALRTSFKDYFNQIYTEKYRAADPSLTTQELIEEGDLESLAGYIAQHKNIGILTNADDIILAPGEYDKLVRLFGRSAMTFPNGGHLGNLAHPAVSYRIVQFLKQ